MKITIIHGQSHKASTYHIARMLSEKLKGEITEFFLPAFFNMMSLAQKHGWNAADQAYWKEKGWLGKKRPWRAQ